MSGKRKGPAGGVAELTSAVRNLQIPEDPTKDAAREAREKERDEARTIRDAQRKVWLEEQENFPRGKGPPPKGDKILGNFFAIKFPNAKANVHKYLITLPPLGRSKIPPGNAEIRQQLIHSLFDINPPFGTSWASDYQSFVVSKDLLYKDWKGLKKGDIRELKHKRPGFPDEIITSLEYDGIVDLKEIHKYCIGQNRPMKIADLNEYIKILNAISWKRINDGFGGIGPLFTTANDGGVKVRNKFYPHSMATSQKKNVREETTSPAVYKIRTGFFFTSMRPSVSGVLLNVNTTTSAFYNDVRLDKWINDFWDKVKIDQNANNYWDTVVVPEFPRFLRGVKVLVDFDNPKIQHTIWSVSRKFLYEQPFELDHKGTLVHEYLAKKYAPNHQFNPNDICVNLGGNNPNKKWYPAEKLKIVPWQRVRSTLQPRFTEKMVKAAVRRPQENKDLISQQALKWLGLDSSNTFYTNFGISADKTFLSLQAQKSISSKLWLKGQTGQLAPLKNAQWTLKDNRFYQVGSAKFAKRKDLRVLRIVTPGSTSPNVNIMLSSLHNYGMLTNAKGNSQEMVCDFTNQDGHVQYMKKLNNACVQWARTAQTSLPVILVLLHKRSHYPAVKHWADCHAGVPTVCAEDGRFAPSKRPLNLGEVANISMKFNFKLQGINHRVEKEFCGAPSGTMFVGADVSHPGKGSEGCPSMAGVVATRDKYCCHYLASARLQTSKTEFIEDLSSMIEERVIAWFNYAKATGGEHFFPKVIFLYRDGVSESQYGMVLKEEPPQIRKGFNDAVGYLRRISKLSPKEIDSIRTPKEVVVIVTKRHHSRFYPDKQLTGAHVGQKDLDINLVSGTAIDSTVINPTTFAFYLQSHHSPIGTAKSALCTLVYPDIEKEHEKMVFSTSFMSKLQEITNNLCYTGSRATKVLSVATPPRYADLLCNRLRMYMRPALLGNITLPIGSTPGEYAAHPDLWCPPNHPQGRKNPWHPNLDDIMFYL